MDKIRITATDHMCAVLLREYLRSIDWNVIDATIAIHQTINTLERDSLVDAKRRKSLSTTVPDALVSVTMSWKQFLQIHRFIRTANSVTVAVIAKTHAGRSMEVTTPIYAIGDAAGSVDDGVEVVGSADDLLTKPEHAWGYLLKAYFSAIGWSEKTVASNIRQMLEAAMERGELDSVRRKSLAATLPDALVNKPGNDGYRAVSIKRFQQVLRASTAVRAYRVRLTITTHRGSTVTVETPEYVINSVDLATEQEGDKT